MGQLTQLLKIAIKKFVVWLIIFLTLYLYPTNLWQNIASGLLAIVLGIVVTGVLWHYLPKDFLTRLDDKAVLITGCDSGFGHMLAQKLDMRGMTVYAGCLFPEGTGAAELKNSCSSRLKILHLDVTNDEHVENAVKSVTSTLGNTELWAVVNNAGIGEASETELTTLEGTKKIIDVNTFGPYRVSKAFLPLLRKSEGRVIIVSSVLGRIAMPGTSVYSMSKFAVTALAESLRRELIKWNISVHIVEPWFFNTNITNEEQITRNIQQNWFKAPKDLKDVYGKEYILEYQVSISYILNWVTRPADKVHEVVDDLEHATIGLDPKVRYNPGLVGNIWVWIINIIPSEIYDIICHFILPHTVKQQQ